MVDDEILPKWIGISIIDSSGNESANSILGIAV